MSNSNNFTLSIQSLIIFDPTLSKNEDEDDKKLLYIYPKSLNNCKATNTVGLCEAMCNFAKEFTSQPCQSIHTLKTRITLLNMEDDIWITLVINVPKNPNKEDEYLEEELKDPICESILEHCQKMFFLFKGPTSLIIKECGIDGLKNILSVFFDRYIGNGMLDGYQLTDTLTGVHLLPVDLNIYSQVSTFITRIEAKFTDIFASLFLFSNSYVWGTVNKDDLGILFRYLIITLLPKINLQDMGNGSFTNKNMGKFMICPPDVPTLYLDMSAFIKKSCSTPKQCQVLVYRVLQVDIVLFIEKSSKLNDQLLSDMHQFIGPQLTSLTQSISKEVKLNTDSPQKYLYWNCVTLSMKCNLFPTRQIKSDFLPLVPLDVMNLMTDVKYNMDFVDQLSKQSIIKEIGVKLNSDCWVVCLKKNSKQLFLAVNKRNFSLVDVSREIKQLCGRSFPGIFGRDTED